jgi:2'-5' RNA ligase
VPRKRFGVALLVPRPLADEIDGLRRALGDQSLDRVPPHLTLVPPVNVRVADVPAALAVLRDAAAEAHPIWVRLGPPATFLPDTPTIHLEVHSPHQRGPGGGSPNHVAHPLLQIRDLVFRPPFERELTWPFVPHVTLIDGAPAPRIAAAVDALADFEHDVCFEEVHLLEEQRGGDGIRRWIPVADLPFGPRTIVGRGGVELELTTSTLVDPEALALEADHARPADEPARPDVLEVVDLPEGARPLVVTARRAGAVVGMVRGWSRDGEATETAVVVHPDHRGQGVARQLALAFHASPRHRAAGTS